MHNEPPLRRQRLLLLFEEDTRLGYSGFADPLRIKPSFQKKRDRLRSYIQIARQLSSRAAMPPKCLADLSAGQSGRICWHRFT